MPVGYLRFARVVGGCYRPEICTRAGFRGVNVHNPGCRPAGDLSRHASPGGTSRGGPRGSLSAEIPPGGGQRHAITDAVTAVAPDTAPSPARRPQPAPRP